MSREKSLYEGEWGVGGREGRQPSANILTVLAWRLDGQVSEQMIYRLTVGLTLASKMQHTEAGLTRSFILPVHSTMRHEQVTSVVTIAHTGVFIRMYE